MPRKRVPRAKRRLAYRTWKANLTVTNVGGDPALKRLIEATPSGTADWSGTGPPGTVCEQCSFFGYDTYPHSCYRYFVTRWQHGPPLPEATPSCQHFRPRSL
jgi:hypothetical protein